MDDLEPSASAYPLLALVDHPSVIRDFSNSQLDQLAEEIRRFIVEAVINEQVSRLSRARFEAPRAEGELLGGRLSGVTQGSLLSSLGFEEGDTVWGVNGFYVATPEQALEAYARLGRADVVEVWFTRKGQMHVQRYNIR